jgi:hypothetical protein
VIATQPVNEEPVPLHRPHVVFSPIDELDILAGHRHPGTREAADRPGAHNRHPHYATSSLLDDCRL